MSTATPLQEKLVSNVRSMLSLYKLKESKKVQEAATNLDWNLKKLDGVGGETIDAAEWARRTAGDMATIASALPGGESGQGFAAGFAGRYAEAFPKPATPVVQTETPPAAPTASSTPPPATTSTSPAPSAATSTPTEASTVPAFDLGTMLAAKVKSAGEKLDWQRSVVDLFKLMGLDASLANRRKTAKAIGLDDDDVAAVGSAAGNEMLHGALLGYMASNEGKIPSGLA